MILALYVICIGWLICLKIKRSRPKEPKHWYLCSLGNAPYFKPGKGESENDKVENGTAEYRLKCVVEATAGEYRWYKDNRLLKNNAKYRMKKFRYLKIKDVNFSDQGLYTCVASNVEGNVSKTVYLSVQGKGMIY